MSHLSPGLISAYNSLTDKHLAGYFSNTRIRRHLQRAGLITRSGRIVPDKEYRHKLIQRAHQRHIRECLAQAIFHKVLEMERVHQIEIKRRLEEFARRERVHKIKVERSKRYEEDIIRILSPRPPTGARGIRKQHSGPEGEHSESSESPGSSRPNTAPGKMQRPVRLKPIHSNNTTASLRRSSPYRLLESSNDNDQHFNCTMDKESRRRLTAVEASRGISPYCLPVINNFVTPVPPATKRKERGVKATPSGTLRGRRLRPTTASSGADVNEDPPMLRSSVHQSRVCVNMMYFGKTVHLSHDLTDMRDEVKVFQQHCGGENLCVYKGLLREGETFQFISRRHRGFPFSLTFFLNGLQVERLSSCCEFKHRKGSRLGGRHGHFGFSSVEGASPCYKCIIAMGLDKKPTPPPKRVKEDGVREESVISPKDAPEMERERTRENAASHSECETSQPQDMETQVKEETAAEEDKVKDEYEEDFEADDEGPAEDVEAKEKKSPSPSGETEKQVEEKDASETEDDEKEDGSSSSGSDREESDAEATKDSREDEKAEQAQEVHREDTAVPPDEKDKPNPEEAAATESTGPKDSDIPNSAGDSIEIDISDTSVPSGNENKQSDDTSGDKEVEKTVDESKEGEEQERAKSVQDKLAEAILQESQCSSEPELSDTSTEEEEESTDKSPEQDNKDAVQQTQAEEIKCEEGVVGEAEVVHDQEEMSEPKGQEDETEQEPHESSDGTKDEEVKINEEDEKAASEEDRNTAENDKSEDTGDTALHPVSEEEMAEDDKTSEPQEDATAKSTDAAEKDEESEENTAVEADTQPSEMGQGAKSTEENESSVSESNKKTDVTAVPDNAEAEAMTASETMELKAEPSEEREALNCEEAPVPDTEKRQLGDSEGRESETEVTAENASSSLEGSRGTAIEKTAETSEGNSKDENDKGIKGEQREEVSAVEASEDDNQQERCDMEEEQTERSVEINDKLEEKPEEEAKEEEKPTNTDEITEGDNSEESKVDDKDKTEEAENNESKTEEGIENKENITEQTQTESNTEGKSNEEEAEKTHSEDDKVANEEKADKSEKTEKDEDSECVKNENDEGESEEKGATTDKTNEGEKISETNTVADEEKDPDAENEEKDQNQNKAEQSEVVTNKDDGETEEKKVTEGQETSETAEEPEKSADAALDKDNVTISEENIVESEDVGDSEAANVAHENKTTEEALNNAMEPEDVKKETERFEGCGEIDAENGEISTGAETKTHEDEGEAQTEGETDVKTADEIKTEEPTEDESSDMKEVGVESGDGAEKQEDSEADQVPDTDVVESEAKVADRGVEKQDESTKNSEPETSGAEIKAESKSDDRKNSEETKQDENGNISDPDHENRDPDLIKKNDNVQSNVIVVVVASSADQEQSAAPIAVDLVLTAHELDESSAPTDSKTDKHPHADENAADLSAADGDNGDTEEASKASEEGASVLLKPQAQSAQLTENNEAENKEESVAVGEETPEALAREDLVTNWVNMHQTSKFFETFVEPLEDLKESDSEVSNSNKEATQSTELPRSASPLKEVKMSENAEQEHMLKNANEDKIKEEAVELNPESNHSEDGEQCEKDPAADTLQVEEETEVKDLKPESESEQNDKESVKGQDMRLEERKGSRGSLEEDKVQEGLMQDHTEQTDVSKTEVESIAGTHHSVTSGRPESVPENQNEEKATGNAPDLNEKQTAVEENKDPLPSSETDKHRERSPSPAGLSESKANEPKDEGEAWEKSREVTEITDFTESKSEDGTPEESHCKETQPKLSDKSVSGDRTDVQRIQDIQHTLSKDRLSTFSVDETLFGRSSYPLLTAARTESGH
ncbi:glutamate-rich protein 3 isoform X2 [Dicentrarchus labrax]|uniref:glutamate-rich protein 3 isoform X2 n=1 Tax=Dicentrarchus labrax TaxID=13489 RepID=UPI0021F52315|nr:glutamate-rich protein 3 isoform X2 [Dicentrarchus labrax]